MSDTLKNSIDELMNYAKGNKDSVEVRVYNFKEVPDYSGEEIREIREKMDLPRNAMADILGVSVRTIEKWEINGAKPNGSAKRLLQLLEDNPLVILDNIKDIALDA